MGLILSKAKAERSGFTLLELLICIGIIAALCAMLVPMLGSTRSASNTAKCTGNLRSVYGMLAAYAADNNGVILMHAYGLTSTPTTRRWADFLAAKEYISIAKSDVQFCPAAPEPKKFVSTGYSYGTLGWLSNPADDPSSSFIEELTNSRSVRLIGMESPASYWLLVDSWSSSLKNQVYIVRNDSDKTAGIHFLHRGKANVLFADGHVKAVTPAEARMFSPNPLSYGFNDKQQPINF